MAHRVVDRFRTRCCLRRLRPFIQPSQNTRYTHHPAEGGEQINELFGVGFGIGRTVGCIDQSGARGAVHIDISRNLIHVNRLHRFCFASPWLRVNVNDLQILPPSWPRAAVSQPNARDLLAPPLVDYVAVLRVPVFCKG